MIVSLVAMTALEKCCITSAYLQWLFHSGEQAVAHGSLVLDRNWVLRNRYFVILYINLYHSLGIFSRWQTDDIFLIFPRKQDLTFQANCLLRRQFAWNVFPRKQDLTFQANCLLRRQFAWNVKSCFLGKIRKNISKCHLLKILPIVLSVKLYRNPKFFQNSKTFSTASRILGLK